MKIQKLKIYKRSLNAGRRTRGNFVIGGYRVESPFKSPVTRQGGETEIHSPFRSPISRTQESIERQRQKEAERKERQKKLYGEIHYKADLEREKTRIATYKRKRRSANRAIRQPFTSEGTRKKVKRSSRAVSRGERQGGTPVGYYYNVASGEYEPRPRGHYNPASGDWE